MSVRKIIVVPDPRLREKASPVSKFDEKLKELARDMAETMQAANGIGLAAVQVAEMTRILAIDDGFIDRDPEGSGEIDEDDSGDSDEEMESRPSFFVNPEILSGEGEIEYEEGCLSIPGVYGMVKRHSDIKLRYQDLDGQVHEIEAHGMRAIVLQHEIDHLNGVLFPDHLSQMNRMMLMNKYNKLQKKLLEEGEE